MNKMQAPLTRDSHAGAGSWSSGGTGNGRSAVVWTSIIWFNCLPVSLSLCLASAVTVHVSGSVFIVLGVFCPHLPSLKPQTSLAEEAHRQLLYLSLQPHPSPTTAPAPLPAQRSGRLGDLPVPTLPHTTWLHNLRRSHRGTDSLGEGIRPTWFTFTCSTNAKSPGSGKGEEGLGKTPSERTLRSIIWRRSKKTSAQRGV